MDRFRPFLIAAAVVIGLSAYWLTRSDDKKPAPDSSLEESVGIADEQVDEGEDGELRSPARARGDRPALPHGRAAGDAERGDEPDRGEEHERSDAERPPDSAREDGPEPDGMAKGKAWRQDRTRELQDVEARIAKLETRAGELEAAGDIPGHDRANEQLGRLHRQRKALEEELER